MKNAKTLTEGPLAKQILLVSLPLALSNLLQVLFNMSDVAVVGRFAGSTALGAVGSTSIFVTLFTGFLIGLSNGINVLVARFYGAKHPGDVKKTVHSALIISFIAGVILLFVGLPGWYQKLAAKAGAGTLVPITGFANSVVSPAIEFKAEGWVTGVGAKIFTIAGPVIAFGTLASFVWGVVYWLVGKVG